MLHKLPGDACHQVDLEERENYCFCDCLLLNKTNNLPSSGLRFPHLLTQTAHFTDLAEQFQFVYLYDPKAVSLSVADFGGHFCGFTSLLRLQDFEAESGEREMISDLTPLLFPSFLLFSPVLTLPTRCSWSVSPSLLQQSSK